MTAQELTQLTALLSEGGIDFLADPTVERQNFEALLGSFPADNQVVVQERTIGGIPGRWMDGERGIVLYLHGGGYTLGSSLAYQSLASAIAQAAGSALFSIDYRLAPEARFPAAVDDSVAAYRGLLEAGLAPQDIVVVGDSAGGGLSVALLVALRDAGIVLPAGAALLSPWADLSLSGSTMNSRQEADISLNHAGLSTAAAHYLGDADPTTPLASPVFADLTGFPPLLIEAGEAEILLSDAVRLAENAAQAGVDTRLHVWPGMVHDWPLFSFMLSEGRDAIAEMGAFIAQQLGAARAGGAA